jgi:diguanylate cyclase (GGDEF)-like protein
MCPDMPPGATPGSINDAVDVGPRRRGSFGAAFGLGPVAAGRKSLQHNGVAGSEDLDDVSDLERTAEHLSLFNTIAKALTSTLEANQVFHVIMEQVSSLLSPSHWALLIRNPEGRLRYEIAQGPGISGLVGTVLPKHFGLIEETLSSNAPSLLKRDPNPKQVACGVGLSTFTPKDVLVIPLRAQGRLIGVLELANSLNKHSSRTDLQTLKAICDYAAIAIDNALHHEQVRHLTQIDEHTGLFNARQLREMLTAEISRAGRYGRPLSLLFMDIDHFKSVNDRYGHLTGSSILAQLGQRLDRCIRNVDAAFRYGGDEFAVLLVETRADQALKVAERLRKDLLMSPFRAEDGSPVQLTLSIGIAAFPDDATDTAGLLRAADQAMYEVKGSGRDGIRLTADLPKPETDVK